MENNEPTRLSGVIPKGWGYELIWATNDKYCGKIMFFEKEGLNVCTFIKKKTKHGL